MRAIYENGSLSFDEYLEFFGYLSTYRLRYLLFTADDLEKAILGDSYIKNFRPDNIAKFNFPITLSDEYGVSFKQRFSFIVYFLKKILADNSVVPAIIERVFIEIIEAFPNVIGKSSVSLMLYKICSAEKEQASNIIRSPENPILKEKIARIKKATEIYRHSTNLWTPGKGP